MEMIRFLNTLLLRTPEQRATRYRRAAEAYRREAEELADAIEALQAERLWLERQAAALEAFAP